MQARPGGLLLAADIPASQLVHTPLSSRISAYYCTSYTLNAAERTIASKPRKMDC